MSRVKSVKFEVAKVPLDNLPEKIREVSTKLGTPSPDNVKVFVGAPKRIKPSTEMMMFFTANFSRIMVENRKVLTSTHITVFFHLCRSCDYGNRIATTRKEITRQTGIHKSELSRAFARLRELGLIVSRDNGGDYISSVIGVKGGINELLDDGKYSDLMAESWEQTYRSQGAIVERPVKSYRTDDK